MVILYLVMKIPKLSHKRLVWHVIIGLALTSAAAGFYYINYVYFASWNRNLDSQIVKTEDEIRVRAEISAKEAKKKQPVYINLPGAQPIRAIVEDYTQADSLWIIVNKTKPISTDYVPTSLQVPNVLARTDKSEAERSLRSDVGVPIKNMFAAAYTAGYQLSIGSAYRSAALQKTYFDSAASSVGVEAANQAIAFPGQSEHQTGLAVDITTASKNCYLDTCFAETNDGQWLAANAYKYGFILRYPKVKESITGYQYEPWHFRYVGIDLATALHDSGLTLDEAWSYLEAADNTLRQNGAI